MPSVLDSSRNGQGSTVEALESRYSTAIESLHEVKRIEWRVGRISEHIAAVWAWQCHWGGPCQACFSQCRRRGGGEVIETEKRVVWTLEALLTSGKRSFIMSLSLSMFKSH